MPTGPRERPFRRGHDGVGGTRRQRKSPGAHDR